MKNRMLSLLLALVMVFSLLPANAQAAEITPVPEEAGDVETVVLAEDSGDLNEERPTTGTDTEEDEDTAAGEETQPAADGFVEAGEDVQQDEPEEPELPDGAGSAAAQALDSGSCGEDLTWTLYDDGALIVAGSGAMTDYTEDAGAPWAAYNDMIITVDLPTGLTGIGEYAFSGCSPATVFYGGTEEQWNAVEKGEGNDALDDAEIIFAEKDTEAVVSETNREAGTSGVTGSGLIWELSDQGTITIVDYDEILLPEYLEIPAEIEGHPVTEIGDYAFYCHGNTSAGGAAQLLWVEMPEGLVRIGEGAFFQSPAQWLVLSSTLEQVGAYAMAECPNVDPVAVPAGLISIGRNAFRLTPVEVDPENPAYCSDEQYVLFNKDKTVLYSVPADISGTYCIPDGVTSIEGESVFYFTFLGDLTFPRSLRRIPAGTFNSCMGLRILRFEHTAEDELVIEDGAFLIDEWLIDIGSLDGPLKTTICVKDPDNVNPAITGYDWTGSNRIVTYGDPLPSGVTDDGLYWQVTDQDTAAITGYSEDLLPEDLTIPDRIEGYPVTEIRGYALHGAQGVRSVSIPASITEIGVGVFGITTSLKKIRVSPDNPCFSADTQGILYDKTKKTLIAAPGALSGKVVIPEGVVTITDEAFDWRREMTEVTIPSSVRSIGDSAFDLCDGLKKLTIPEGVVSIGEDAFHSCYSIKSISLPSTVTEIGIGAFQFCNSLEVFRVAENNPAYRADSELNLLSRDGKILYQAMRPRVGPVVVPDGVEQIEPLAFESHYDMTELILPEGLVRIGYSAFNGCSEMLRVSIPATVTWIGEDAFRACDKLNEITFGHGAGDALTIEGPAFKAWDLIRTLIRVPDVNNINSTLAGYDWEGSRRNAEWLPMDAPPVNGEWNGLIYAPAPDEGLIITGHTKAFSSELVIPGEINGYPVTAIAPYVFRGCDELTSVTLPAELRSIGIWAFSLCRYINWFRVDTDSLYFCSDERGVLFSKDMTLLIQAPGMLSGEYVIPDGVKRIGTDSFDWIETLTRVTFPESVMKIERGAFADCTGLTEVVFEHGRNAPLHFDYDAFQYWGDELDRTEEVRRLIIRVPDAENINPFLTEFNWLGCCVIPLIAGPSDAPRRTLPRMTLVPLVPEGTQLLWVGEDGEPARYEADAAEYILNLDASVVEGKKTFKFTVWPEFLTGTGITRLLKSSKTQYSTTDASVAEVKLGGHGRAEIIVKAPGACTISCKAESDGMTQRASLTIHVRDYTPRLESTAITVNSWKTDGVSVPLIPGYDNEIVSAMIADSDKFEASFAGGLLTIKTKGEQKNGTTKKVPLTVQTLSGEKTYTIPLSITVKNAKPSVTVKQTQKYNTFYTDSEARFEITAPGEIEEAVFETATYTSRYSDGLLLVTKKADAPAKTAAKGTLTVTVKGYTRPFEKTISVGTENKKADLALSGKAFTINRNYGAQTVRFNFVGAVPSATPEVSVKPAGAANCSYSDGTFTITDIVKTATITIKVRDADWTAPMTFSAKITVNTGAATVKATPSTLLLNAAYPNAAATAKVTLSGADAALKADETVLNAEGDAISVVYADGVITAKIRNGETPKAGTYKFTYTPAIDTPDGPVTLKAVTVSVKVVNTATITPSVTAAGKLDAVRRNDTSVTYTVTKLANITGIVESIELMGADAGLFDLGIVDEPAKGLGQAVLTLKENADVSTKASYKIQLVIRVSGIEDPVLSKVLTVKVTQSKLKVSVTPKTATLFQSQDTTRPAEFILTLTAPAGAEIRNVTLSEKTPLSFLKSLGKNAVVSWVPQADGTVLVKITVKDPAKVASGKSYKVVLDITPVGNAANVKPTSTSITVKVKK